jgi:AmmeMemoRadiSam system protein B
MSLNFAAISPHPPLLIPEIGKEDLVKVADTTVAMRKLAHTFGDAEIDTLIVISPHGLVYPDRFSVSAMSKNFGTFAHFDSPNITFGYNNELELVDEIIEQANFENIPIVAYDNGGEFYELDHGIMVPLYYLRTSQEMGLKILPISYSNLTRAEHFSFGQVIGKAAKKYGGRVGILASGDLSHRLISGAPTEDPEAGKNFDWKITQDLVNYNVEDIVLYEEDFVENAGECGYRSILVLLGALDTIDAEKIKPELLSYEGPFGVGYSVINFNLPES